MCRGALAAGLTRTARGAGICAGRCQGTFACPVIQEQTSWESSTGLKVGDSVFLSREKRSVQVEINVAVGHGDNTITLWFLLL